MRRRVEQAWRIRWGGMLACAAARAFAASLLEQRVPVGSDGSTPPSHEVVADHRYAGLGKRPSVHVCSRRTIYHLIHSSCSFSSKKKVSVSLCESL